MAISLETQGRKQLTEIVSRVEFKSRILVFSEKQVVKPILSYWPDSGDKHTTNNAVSLMPEAMFKQFKIFLPGEAYGGDNTPEVDYWDLAKTIDTDQLVSSFYGLRVPGITDGSFATENYDYSNPRILPHPRAKDEIIPFYGSSYIEGGVDPIKLWRMQKLVEKIPYFVYPDILTELHLTRLLIEGNDKLNWLSGYGSTEVHKKTGNSYDGIRPMWESWADLLQDFRKRIGNENIQEARKSLPPAEELELTIIQLLQAGFPIDPSSLKKEIMKGNIELTPLYYVLIKNATPLLKKLFLDKKLKLNN